MVAIPGTNGITLAPPKPPVIQDSFKKALRWLAHKAAKALQGIIGSIILWIFRVTASVIGWLAENLWELLVAGGVLIVAAVNKYNRRRHH